MGLTYIKQSQLEEIRNKYLHADSINLKPDVMLSYDDFVNQGFQQVCYIERGVRLCDYPNNVEVYSHIYNALMQDKQIRLYIKDKILSADSIGEIIHSTYYNDLFSRIVGRSVFLVAGSMAGINFGTTAYVSIQQRVLDDFINIIKEVIVTTKNKDYIS